jgi:hypothetical protein
MGWVPLGFGEVYTPPYRVSPTYFRNVNESSTVINKNVNITNVYNTTYVVNKTTNVTVINNNQRYTNMSAPGAVTAMPQAAFAGGRPVARNAVSATPAQVAQIQPGAAAMLAPTIAPTRQALAPVAGAGPAARPPRQLMARQVIAKHAPPAPPASFATQQSYLQQHAGQPFDAAAMHKAAPARPAAIVKQAPVAKAAVPVHAGQKVGNQAALSRPPSHPSKPAGNPQTAAQPHPPSPTPQQPARPVATSPAAAHAAPPPPAPKAAARQNAPAAKPAPVPAAARTQPPANPPTPAAKAVAPAKPVTPAKTPPLAVHPVPPSHVAAPAHPVARPDDKQKKEDEKKKKEPQ